MALENGILSQALQIKHIPLTSESAQMTYNGRAHPLSLLRPRDNVKVIRADTAAAQELNAAQSQWAPTVVCQHPGGDAG
jgi:hypothetical protein